MCWGGWPEQCFCGKLRAGPCLGRAHRPASWLAAFGVTFMQGTASLARACGSLWNWALLPCSPAGTWAVIERFRGPVCV